MVENEDSFIEKYGSCDSGAAVCENIRGAYDAARVELQRRGVVARGCQRRGDQLEAGGQFSMEES